MKIGDGVYMLEIARQPDDTANPFNLSLILDPAHGPTLVDTGLPGQAPAIADALGEAGVRVDDLASIIVTHQDLDHVGSLHDLVAASGAHVLAHTVETPAIDGTTAPRFATPAMLEQRPELRPVVESFRPTPVDQQLEDGTRLDWAGGIRVVFTPGHTPGHMCLFLERGRILIAGDALTAADGRLNGPNERATQDMAQAAQSVRKLAELDVATIVCYHGGVVRDDAAGQLRRVAQELASDKL